MIKATINEEEVAFGITDVKCTYNILNYSKLCSLKVLCQNFRSG